MHRAVKGQEQLAYVGAATVFAALPGNTQSIEAMIRLALEGICPAIRQRAKDWLLQSVGVKVVDEGVQDATEAATARLR